MAIDDDKPKVDMAQANRQLRENMPAMLEWAELNAQITHRKFLAYQKAGFTVAQALQLCLAEVAR